MLAMINMLQMDEDDREFIQRLFLENETAMYIAANQILHDYHVSRDMVSETCMTMIQKVDYLREVEDHKRTSYIISIVRNYALMYLRRRKIERRIFLEEMLTMIGNKNMDSRDVDAELITEAEVQMIHEALSKIHKKDRELLKMKYFEQMPDAAIGYILKINPASVRFYLTQARRKLAAELKWRYEE